MNETLMPALSQRASRLGTAAFAGERILTDRQTHGVSRRLASPLIRVLDQAALTLALVLTVLSQFATQTDTIDSFLRHRISLLALVYELGLLLSWRVLFWIMSLYQPKLIRGIGSFLWRIPLTVVPCAGILIPIFVWHMNDPQLIRSLFTFWFIGTTLMLSTRAGLYTYDEVVRPMLRRQRSVIICGTGYRAQTLALELATHPDYRYTLMGFVDSDPQGACERLAPMLGGVDDMDSLLMKLPVDEVIIALPVKSCFADIERIVSQCGRAGVQLQYSLDLFSTDIAKNRTLDAADPTRVVLEMVALDHRLALKNMVDRTAAGIGLLLLSPLMLAIALLIKLTSKGPVFFVQQRYGLNKRRFGMIKFRSMVTDAEARLASLEHLNQNGPMFKMKNDPRITAIGKLIRRTSLDELPQLINVLRGEMSLVGPRPLPQSDVERFSEGWLMRRFSVKPGITGLWQVSGRSSIDFDGAIKLDLRYIDKWSLAMDAKILLRTLSAVVKGSGAY
jgi:exopolysaccharide biosynthesis polyprenyl glycosylphosphotransferase